MIYLDCGHGWKGAEQGYDPGAIQGPRLDQQEAVIARHYGAVLVAALHAAGTPVTEVPASGRYADRHRWVADHMRATKTKRAVYAQLHCNDGGGSYALVEYDARSARGSRAARVVVDSLGPLAGRVQIKGLAEGERGHTCISGIWPIEGISGLIIEPGFLDQQLHAPLWERPEVSKLGHALANGLRAAMDAP